MTGRITRRGLAATMAMAATTRRASAQGVPAGTCDTHVHILDPDRFPYSPSRRYTPGSATVARLREWHDRLGIARTVVVQNSAYGTDHSCLLDALKQLGPDHARGVGTLGPATTDAEIVALHAAGVRGTRLNLEVGKDRNIAAAEAQLRWAAGRMPGGWFVHINAGLAVIAGLADVIASLGTPTVLDHFAHIEIVRGIDQPGVEQVRRLMRAGKVVVKLSGPYQVSDRPGYADIAPLARMLVETAPGQVMWGSDWPHTGGAGRPADQPVAFIEPFRPEDDARNFALLETWVPDPAIRRRILVDTPAALYGFTPG